MKRISCVLLLLFLSAPLYAGYGARMGMYLTDLSKANMDRIKMDTEYFHFQTGVNLSMVVQKRQDLLIKLFQGKDVDVLITGLPQVLALEKAGTPFKILLRGYRALESDKFILVMRRTQADVEGDNRNLTFPVSRHVRNAASLIMSSDAAKQPMLMHDIASMELSVQEMPSITYTPAFFRSVFAKDAKSAVIDIASFDKKSFGRIQSQKDISLIEKACRCAVAKMSAPIPPLVVIARQEFFEKYPLVVYKIMDFMMNADNIGKIFIKDFFGIDGFYTATQNLIAPFSFFVSRFNFQQLMDIDI